MLSCVTDSFTTLTMLVEQKEPCFIVFKGFLPFVGPTLTGNICIKGSYTESSSRVVAGLCTINCVIMFVLVLRQQKDGIMAILAAVLHISDIEFERDAETEGVSVKNDDVLVLGQWSASSARYSLHQCINHLHQ